MLNNVRNTDPESSKRAARSIKNRQNHMDKLLKSFADGEALINEEAFDRAVARGEMSPKSCGWRRCTDLREAGLIEWAKIDDVIITKRSSMGRFCQASWITPKGKARLAELEGALF